MDLNEFEKNVIKWATERGIYPGSTSKDQLIKLIAEAGELGDALFIGDRRWENAPNLHGMRLKTEMAK